MGYKEGPLVQLVNSQEISHKGIDASLIDRQILFNFNEQCHFYVQENI